MSQVSDSGPAQPRLVRAAPVAVGVLITIVLAFAVIRVITDWPHILDGTPTDNDFAKRYVAHPVLGYVHIGAGVIYLLGAALQVTKQFRVRHYAVHRRMGRVVVAAGVVAGVFAIVFGIEHPWGRWPESAAAVVFGGWFVLCLVAGLRAIRGGDMVQHRRWMIRAFAVGTGIGTIRLWVGLFIALTLTPLPAHATFGLAFWLALTMHVAAGEWWLRHTPPATG